MSGRQWLNNGKFDKIAFSISEDHYIVGVVVGPTFQADIPVTMTVKVTDIAGKLIVMASRDYTFKGVELQTVLFDRANRITAGQQYIAATMVYALPSTYPSLLTFVRTVTSTQCGPVNMTVTFSNVPQAEMDDSNGSTVDEGRVPRLIFKPL